MDYTPILHLLQCPSCGGELIQRSTELLCTHTAAHRYPIKNGIVRFVSQEEGIDYDTHWKNFSKNAISLTKINQAENFIKWFLKDEDLNDISNKIVLDIGCGDGNHLPSLPQAAIKIAIDYSCVVDLVARRYKDLKNLFIIQADAQHLPFKENVADYCISYGCLNCLPNPAIGVREVARVLNLKGTAALWGYGTNSSFVFYGLNWVRRIYKFLGNTFLQKLFTIALIPSLYFVKNSTNIKLGKNSFQECYEIVSTNLTPNNLHIFYRCTWQVFCPPNLKCIENYELSCGQKLRLIN